MTLSEKINNKECGILTYGFTPPKENNSPDKIKEIAGSHLTRLNDLASEIDAIVLYDIQDEKERIAEERTFPFLPTLDPDYYSNIYLDSIDKPKIIYKCVGNYSTEQFIEFLKKDRDSGREKYNVFVGSASDIPNDLLKLSEAYE